jgi:predicted nucleotidyltransferase
MYPHHHASIQRTIDYFRTQPDVLALLLGGSIAHGFATPASDVDIMIVISDEDFQRRRAASSTQFFSTELVTYPNSYVDGKYISRSHMRLVEERGSEPARFAFADSQVLFATIDGVAEQIERIARYPAEQKLNRIRRFHAQMHAWHWYAGEAERHHNPYLMGIACQKLALFGARMVLALNEQIFPYHKWLPAVLARCADRPDGMLDLMERMSRQPSYALASEWHALILGHRAWESEGDLWGNAFMRDSELNWVDAEAPVDDL